MHSASRLGLLGGFLLGLSAFAAPPVIQSADSVGVVLGDAVEYHVVALDNVTGYSAQGLPPGVAINGSTGLVSGTPTEVGSYRSIVRATNGDGTSSTVLTISVVSPSAGPLIYAPLSFDAFNDLHPGGDRFSCPLKATGNPTSYQATAPLPAGWSLSGGTIVGSSATPGLYSVPVSATNANGIGSAAITIRVHAACLQVQSSTGNLRAGDVFRVTLQFNRAVTFSGDAPYLEFHIYPDPTTRRLAYVSGNGTSTFEFLYTVQPGDPPGDIMLYSTIQPAAAGAVTGLADQDGVTLGASLPAGAGTASARIIASTVSTPTPSTPVASTAPSGPAGGSAGTITSSTGGAGAVASGGAIAGAPAAGTGSASATNTSPAAPTGNPGTAVASGAPAGDALSPTGSTSGSVGDAALTQPAAAGSQLVNLSARATVSATDPSRSFIVGFVVSGTKAKTMLLRAIGPSLAGFGVQGATADPRLQLFDSGGKVVAENDDWSGADVTATSAAVGAFALAPGSRDAARVVSLPPGNYSMQVSPADGSGVALAEIYDADGPGAAPLLNISTRAFVDHGEGVLTAGFVVSGSQSKRLLVRGVGPGLASYGVAGALRDPVVTLYQGGTAIARNDNWQTPIAAAAAAAGDIATATSAVGAFPLAAGSKDAALVVTLNPGAYSATVSSADDATGPGLVEVYEVR